jgi:hypothetical protein
VLTASVIAAARPTARVAHLGAAGLTVALGAVPAVVVMATGGTSVATALIVASLAAGAALGWAGEDPAAEVLAPLPVAASVRASLRVAFAAAVAVGLSCLLALAVWMGPGLPAGVGDRLPEAATAAAAALALAFVLARRGERGSGAAGVAGGLVLPAFVSAMAFRWPRVLPSFDAGPIHDRWWLAVLAGALVVARAGRDPARR